MRPDTVPAGQLARLVIEAVSLLEAVARERGLEAPPVFLQGIRKGSCVARLYPIDHGRDDPFERIAAHTHRVIETRAETAAPSVRAAVERIWSLAQTGGAPVRIAARNISHLKAAPKAVMVAEPIRQQRPSARSATI
ncbi:MAG: hypothetical protein K8H88_29070, partial [Sandaracinaceae bacterium]|nr:hypothetical protein [Sandaracinaceae bacterium]